MLTNLVKWIALVAAMALVVLSWRSPLAEETTLATLVVWTGTIVSLVQALTMRRYGWAWAFLVLGVVFNPILPLDFPRNVLLGLNVMCVAVFACSLAWLKSMPRLSLASITDTSPRSESL